MFELPLPSFTTFTPLSPDYAGLIFMQKPEVVLKRITYDVLMSDIPDEQIREMGRRNRERKEARLIAEIQERLMKRALERMYESLKWSTYFQNPPSPITPVLCAANLPPAVLVSTFGESPSALSVPNDSVDESSYEPTAIIVVPSETQTRG